MELILVFLYNVFSSLFIVQKSLLFALGALVFNPFIIITRITNGCHLLCCYDNLLLLFSLFPHTAPPTFRIKPPDVIYVKIGESITLPCEAVGTPTPQIVWFKVSQQSMIDFDNDF